MRRILTRRGLQSLLVALGVGLLAFLITRLLPGDPAASWAGPRASAAELARVRIQLGLDQPMPVQAIRYMGDLVRGDWGTSIHTRQPVLSDVSGMFMTSLELVTVALVIAGLIGIPLATTVIHAVVGWFGLQLSLGWSDGWNTVLAAAGANVGALLAGSAAVRVVARSGSRRPEEVRLAVTAVGAVALGWLVLVAIERPLNWASAIALLVVPVSFGIGTRIARPAPRSLRTAGATLGIGLTLVTALSLGLAVTGGDARVNGAGYQWSATTHGYEMIAPWWQDPAGSGAMDFVSGTSGWSTTGVDMVTVDAASPAVAARFHDYRLEAWQAQSPQDGWRLLPGQARPFATAAASVDGATVSGTLVFNQTPGVDWAQVILTAIGPDGRRYLLSGSGPEQTQFYGSVWS